jgi:hypothetical protein
MGAIFVLLLLFFLPGAIVNAFKVVEFGFSVVGFLISAALTVVVLVFGFLFVLALLAH